MVTKVHLRDSSLRLNFTQWIEDERDSRQRNIWLCLLLLCCSRWPMLQVLALTVILAFVDLEKPHSAIDQHRLSTNRNDRVSIHCLWHNAFCARLAAQRNRFHCIACPPCQDVCADHDFISEDSKNGLWYQCSFIVTSSQHWPWPGRPQVTCCRNAAHVQYTGEVRWYEGRFFVIIGGGGGRNVNWGQEAGFLFCVVVLFVLFS